MAAAERRRGRRDNGLEASDWRAIEDLDPRVAEEVLDLLAARGIAAYVQPAVDVDPVTRSATLPGRPADRLYVDRQRAKAAREHLRGLLASYRDRPTGESAESTGQPAAGRDATDRDHDPEVGPASSKPPRGQEAADPVTTGADAPDGTGGQAGSISDLDTTFAGIVAGFDRPVDPTAAVWPAAENLSSTTTADQPATTPVERVGPIDARDVTEASLLDALDTFGADLPDEDTPERFVPPPPPPLPRFSRQTVLGGLAIVVGLVLLIGQPAALPVGRSGTMLLGFAMILGGAVALILRLRPGTDPEEDRPPGDGAQV